MKFFFASVLGGMLFSASAQEQAPLDFQEIFRLVRTNLSDLSEESLSRAAAAGLIKELGAKVQLITSNTPAPQLPEEPVTRRSFRQENCAWLQVRSVDDRLPAEFQKWLAEIATNAVRGLVIDLRYAEGISYAAAAQVAEAFAKEGGLLLKVGPEEFRASGKSKPVATPVAVLVNRETRGAAEALAALIRETGAGLIIGGTTAGEARVFETFNLSTGQQLKIGAVPVEVGRDRKILPAKGLDPDIAVTVSAAAEKIFYQDPYRAIPVTGPIPAAAGEPAASRPRRVNEAELVRRHRAGGTGEDPAPAEASGDLVVNDPVLARALDFLKGISALQQNRL